MQKVIVLSILIFGSIPAFSQTDSLLLEKYEQKILENSKLKTELQTEKQNFSALSVAYKRDTLALKKKIIDLCDELSSEKRKVSVLNKYKIKAERDNLNMKVDSLKIVISEQKQTISGKDKEIFDLRARAKTSAENAKNEGKSEAFASIADLYKNQSFDYIILSSGKESAARDIQLVGDIPEVKPVINDLLNYFKAQELLSREYDGTQIKNAQTQLSQIKRQSELLDALKDDVEFYHDFSNALKGTIGKVVDLDNRKSAGSDSEIQKLKFDEIVTILTDYIYNYYDYDRYQYLYDIVLEIIKRKRLDADADVADLLRKLE